METKVVKPEEVVKSEVIDVQLSQAQILMVRLYARLKRVEKHIKDKIEKSKNGLLSLLPSFSSPLIPDSKMNLLSKDAKIASITVQDKEQFDVEGLKKKYPKLYARFAKRSEPYTVIRIH